MPTSRETRFVRLVVDASGARSGGTEVRTALDEIQRSARATAAEVDRIRAAPALDTASDSARRLSGRLGNVATQSRRVANTGLFSRQGRASFINLGQQLQDVAVQAEAGTDQLRILAQQGPQIASVFGPAGVSIGIVVAVAATAASLLNTVGAATEDARRAIDDLNSSTGRLEGGMSGLEQAALRYSEAIRTTSSAQVDSSDIIVAQTRREFLAKQELLSLEVERGRIQQEQSLVRLDDLRRAEGELRDDQVSLEDRITIGRATARRIGTPFGDEEIANLTDRFQNLESTTQLRDIGLQIRELEATLDLNDLRLDRTEELLGRDFEDIAAERRDLRREPSRRRAPGGSRERPVGDRLNRLTDQLNPIGAAQRELVETQALLNEAVGAGLLTDEQAVEVLSRKRDLLSAQLDPLGALRASLSEELELTRLGNTERTLEIEFRRQVAELQRQGVDLTAQETEALREQIAQIQRLRQTGGELGEVQGFAQAYGGAISDAGQAFGVLADQARDSLGEQSAAFKALFAVQQAVAIAQIGINTAVGVTKALELPPPAGEIAAASRAALGAAQVGIALGTTVAGFRDGGFVSGPGGPREDRIPALLSDGEFIVNSAATARNRGALEAINGGGTIMSPAPVINVITEGVGPVDVERRQGANGQQEIIIRRAVAAVATDIRDGGGPVDRALATRGQPRRA